MQTILDTSPHVSAEDAARLLQDAFGIEIEDGSLEPLPSERDQNFLVRVGGSRAWVLKITNAAEPAEVLDFQNKAIAHLARHTQSLRLPTVCRTSTAGEIARVGDGTGRIYLARVLSYVDGVCWADVRPKGETLLKSLGRQLAEMGRALASFEHPAMDRHSEWDVRHAAAARAELSKARDPEERAMLERILDRFDTCVLPRADTFRKTVIHADWNDYNVLVDLPCDPEHRVVGAIDFGDMVRTWTITDLAIALAYALTDSPDPLGTAAVVVRAYHEVWPIPEHELEVLFDLVRARLCISAANALRNKEHTPENDYLQISQSAVWRLIRQFDSLAQPMVLAVLRDACGLPASKRGSATLNWLARLEQGFWPIAAGFPYLAPPAVVDLSVGSQDVPQAGMFMGGPALRSLIETTAAETGGVAIGRYAEARLSDGEIAQSSPNHDGAEAHTIHLGIDLFLPSGSEVRAPLPGTVHSVHIPMATAESATREPASVLIEHAADHCPFFTLYRHLDPTSIAARRPGSAIAAGEVIGVVGSAGNWPPHVHVQLLLEPVADARTCPSLAPPSRRQLWQSLCPDPSVLLGCASAGNFVAESPSVSSLLAARHRHVPRSLSISYRRPLAIVRGDMQYLFDDEGRRYLDGVNNVAHVGHSHPRVVNAVNRQMAVLNTNTRYLHANLSRYAERLSALMPAPLTVCFLVCSGSEANELALRLVRAHTKRHGMIVIDHAYHGNTGALVDLSPYKCEGPGGQGLPKHVRKVVMPDVYRGPYRLCPETGSPAKQYVRHVHDAIDDLRAGGTEVAAFVAESLLGCGGQVVLPDSYLAEAYEAVRAAGGVCIADEVQIGFGRTGSHMWGFETQHVIPDIVTLGKSIGNGFPLGAVLTTAEIAASFDNGMEYFNTYGGNPVACAAGLAVLDVIEEEHLQDHALHVGRYLIEGLRALERHAIVGDVRGLGLFVGVELVNDRETLEPAPRQAAYVVNRLRERGVLLSTDGPLHNVIKIKPPLAFDRRDAAQLVSLLDEILAEDAAQPSA